jgi:diguanylate cyclase (GGDEF)-like protein
MSAPAAIDYPVSEFPQPAVDGGADTERQLAPAELLIVDDDAATLERLQLFAEDAGYNVYIARNGREALQLLQQQFCPLVLADIIMPEMSGTSLCAAIRSTPFPGYVYTIALSACDDPDDVVTALDAGADDFLSKRATRSELMARLRAGRRVVGLEQTLRQALDENRKLCHVDAMTGCFNRHYFIPELDRELSRGREHNHWVSVLMCEIDEFKKVNDAYGHDVGDEVLRQVATRIKSLSGDHASWVAYCGGDEFVVVLPEMPFELACGLAESINRDFRSTPVSSSIGVVPLTVSVGVSGAGPSEFRHPLSAAMLLDAVEDCVYDCKAAGRNTVTAHAYQRRSSRVSYLAKHRKGK